MGRCLRARRLRSGDGRGSRGAGTIKRFTSGAVLIAFATTTLVALAPQPSRAANQAVAMKDNRFEPEEIRIDPGDTVVWTNQGSRAHTVTADDRSFNSGDVKTGESYSRQFTEEGFYYYFCKYHGGRGGVGMAGVVIVGDPKGEGIDEGRSDKEILVVPKEYNTIQKAVNAAQPGSLIKIRPGTYREAVTVQTSNLTIKGVDRFRTVLHGGDKKANGFLVDGVKNVRISNLTVRNYRANGIFFNDVHGYQADRIDAIKNRTYGVYAFDSYNGVFKKSFGYGSGDSAFYVGQCLGCGALLEDLVARKNFLGYSGTNATGVVIRDSVWKDNGAGIVPNTLPTEEYAPNRGTTIYRNRVFNNNYKTIPAAGFSETVSIPFGTGIWLAGTHNNLVRNNEIYNHESFGVFISESIHPDSLPMNNKVVKNWIRRSNIDGDEFGWDLAWTGEGADNCFSFNDYKGPTGPPDIETLYACENRPFVGVPYPPVSAYAAASLCCPDTREQKEPPEPKRPRCQIGAPGCDRKKR
ncbi:MAG: right-handed parallel beta-helix repeat-containing protein [Actinobacteria bacterium]|nr:right-handed parallel beta-helix repeat-containing protein [Actinomycetota bacterium]